MPRGFQLNKNEQKDIKRFHKKVFVYVKLKKIRRSHTVVILSKIQLNMDMQSDLGVKLLCQK